LSSASVSLKWIGPSPFIKESLFAFEPQIGGRTRLNRLAIRATLLESNQPFRRNSNQKKCQLEAI
jgi:hypothetical protein